MERKNLMVSEPLNYRPLAIPERDIDQLIERIIRGVLDGIDQISSDELLDANAAADLLKVSRSTIERWTAKGDIPSEKIGGTRRYRRSDLLRQANPKQS